MFLEEDPLISIITVNWNGKKYLADLFTSIGKLNYPQKRLQVIMVDNASKDDSVRYVKKRFSYVQIIQLKENMGYTGGNNEGLCHARGKYIALINNDCTADPDWLNEMLSIFRNSSDDVKIGAVGPKVLFYWPYIPVQLLSGSINSIPEKKLRGKSRRLGINIREARVKGTGSGNEWQSSEIRYIDGFYPPKTVEGGRIARWTQGDAVMAVPVFNTEKTTCLEMKVSSNISPNNLKIVIGEEIIDEIRLGKRTKTIRFKIPTDLYVHKRDIINSCGVKINSSFYSRDRGFMSFDDGQYNSIEEIFALSGSSFMVDREMIADIGCFDPFFFTYYEDIDLFWRARLRGWKHFFAPDAVIRHHHCGSGQEWSYDFTYNVLRNRLLMIYKIGWPRIVLRSIAGFVVAKTIHTMFYLGQLLRGRKKNRIDIGIRFRIFFRLFYLLPAFLPKRIKIRSGKRIRDRYIKEWFRDFK